MFGRKKKIKVPKSKAKIYGLGRKPEFDERSKNFPVRSMLTETTLRNKTWRRQRALNQKDSPECVGYSLWGAFNTSPLTRKYPLDQRTMYSPTEIYRGAQLLDEWEGEDYEGTSVLGGVKWMQRVGLIEEYRWCFSVDEVLQTLSNVGPVVVGTNWLANMFKGPDPEPGRTAAPEFALTCSGSVAGGHAYELHGIDVDDELVIATNSWGVRWGDEGRMYIKWTDLEALLSDQGEALVII